ncbi:hypothetical protein [Rhodococcus oxybenzonivorans]|uniref:hypothetical protein n=1 Tax=Rhodococcus oxybenzonivorans TaxID=1990687 RepID=UPI0013A5531F|nr:hypothetical protein [Rhodococcus oxybenzonivorans]
MTEIIDPEEAADKPKPAKKRKPRKAADFNTAIGPNLRSPAFDRLLDPKLTSSIIDRAGINKAFTEGLSPHTNSIAKLAGFNMANYTGANTIGNLLDSPAFKQSVLGMSDVGRTQGFLDAINEQITSSIRTPGLAEWAASPAASTLTPSLGILAASMNVGETNTAIQRITEALADTAMTKGITERLVFNMPNLFPSISPLRDWMEANNAAMTAMTSPLLDIARNAHAHLRDDDEDQIEFDVDNTTLVLPQLTELAEAYESGDFDQPSFSAFSEAIEESPEWREAIDNAVDRAKAALFLPRKTVRVIVKLGIFLSLATVVTVVTIAGGTVPILAVVIGAMGAQSSMGDVHKFVDEKLLPDKESDEVTEPDE